MLACKADTQGRLGWEHKDYPQVDYFWQARNVAAAITPKQLVNAEYLTGQALGDALSAARIKALAQFKQDYHA